MKEEKKKNKPSNIKIITLGVAGGVIGGFLAYDIMSGGYAHQKLFSTCKDTCGNLKDKLSSSAEVVKDASSDIGSTISNAASEVADIV